LTLLAVREGIIACRLEGVSFCEEKPTALTVGKPYVTMQYSLAQRGFDYWWLKIIKHMRKNAEN